MVVDVLVIGSGAREHALAWKLAQSPRIGKLYVAPGNSGTAGIAENVPIEASDLEGLAKFARAKNIGLTVVGPDDVLAMGVVGLFTARGLRIFGPTKEAAQIESSKAFSKVLMQEGNIPTAKFAVFNSAAPALAYIRTAGVPIVVKASGLALGKGVYVCKTMAEAEQAVKEVMIDRVHKDAGSEVVVEEYLDGSEVSIHALSDGITYMLFPPAQDHKRALDGDRGNNTGGMGTIAPVPWVTLPMMSGIESQVVTPTFDAFRKRGAQFKGVLFPGIMMTEDGPKVLEYNARFGDPETQVYMRLLSSDLLDLLEACVDGTLFTIRSGVEWNRGFAANVVIASGGYPNSYEKGFPITGIEDAEKVQDVIVFHAGTKIENGQLVTSGGRVLSISATGGTLKQALDRAYKAVERIHFKGMQFRTDIGAGALGSE